MRAVSPGEPRRVAYLYLLPGLAVFAAFVLVPLLHTGWIALFEWDGVSAGEWVGLDNFTALFTEPELRTAFWHALVLLVFYSVLPVAIRTPTGVSSSRAFDLRFRSPAPVKPAPW